MRTPRRLPLCFLLLCGASVLACGPSKASKAVHVPGEDATIGDYEDMLKRAEAALADVGVAGSPPQAAPAATESGADVEAPTAEASDASVDERATKNSSTDFNGDCATLCDLSSTTCELEVRICIMAGRHSGDVRYENACSRASGDCELAEGVADQSCECEY